MPKHATTTTVVVLIGRCVATQESLTINRHFRCAFEGDRFLKAESHFGLKWLLQTPLLFLVPPGLRQATKTIKRKIELMFKPTIEDSRL